MEAPNRFQVIYSDIKKVKLQIKSNPNLSLDPRKEIKTNKVAGLFEKRGYYHININLYSVNWHIYLKIFTCSGWIYGSPNVKQPKRHENGTKIPDETKSKRAAKEMAQNV